MCGGVLEFVGEIKMRGLLWSRDATWVGWDVLNDRELFDNFWFLRFILGGWRGLGR